MTARRKIADRLFGFLCLGAVGVAGLLLVVLLWSVFKDGFSRLNGSFFENFTSRLPAKAGIKAAIWGSLWVIATTAFIAVPLGVAAAVWLEEYNSRRNRLVDFIQLNISNLAGVPSIVYGLLGLAVFVRSMGMGRSILAASCTMALLILPMVIIVSQEALKAVPRSYREASFGLGATRWQTIRHQVLPNALPGILTGIILAVSRVLGESAPLVVVGAVSYIAAVPKRLGDEFTVLPLQIFDWTSRPQSGFHDAAAAAIIVLLGILLVLNGAAIFLRARTRRT
ncbi:phosphate ABC transporter permease PstA [soil metagenome]